MDKFAIFHRGLLSDSHTVRSTTGPLDRSLRISRSDTDTGFEAVASPRRTPHIPLSLLESAQEAGLQLRQGGLTTKDTPSHPLELMPLTHVI